MIQSQEVTLKNSEAIELYLFLQQAKPTSDKISFVFMKNLQVLKSIFENFDDKKSILMLNNAHEKDGVLVKDDKGNYEYSKSGRISLDNDLASLRKETVKVSLFQMEINEEIKKMPLHFVATLLDRIFVEKKS